MKDIFYFEKEQILCWVSGYDGLENTDDLKKQIHYLQSNKKKFLTLLKSNVFFFNFAKINVKSTYIHKSCRYKYMRVFWCKIAESDILTQDVYIIRPNPEWPEESQWTMWKWLTD